jgi:hypothetical protein
MNRINPIYVGLFLLLTLGFSMLKLGSVKDELSMIKEEYTQTTKIATELSALKDVYANKKKTEQSLKRVLRMSSLKSANIVQSKKKSGVKISSQSIDLNALNSLMAKILNGTYNVTALKIRKLSNTKSSLEMEIKW